MFELPGFVPREGLFKQVVWGQPLGHLDMFTQASFVKDSDRFDMTHAPPDLLRVARSYQACNDVRVGDGYVELSVPMPDVRAMKVMLRLNTQRDVILLSVDARYFSCLKTSQFHGEREAELLTGGSVDWTAPTPRLELQVDMTTPGFSRAVEEALDAMRTHWSVPIGGRRSWD